MKTNFFKIFLCLFFVFNSFANSGDEVRNGGGLAENYLIFALKNLGHSIDICLFKTACATRPGDRDLLLKIKKSLPDEIKNDIIQFSSESERPGFFTIDGFPRIAVTGDQIGSKIYYNLDMLYSNGSMAINYGSAIQSLIHELGHHQGVIDHNQLEVLGTEVRSSNDGSVVDIAFLPYLNKSGFSSVGIEGKSFENNGLLALVFKDGMIDLTSLFDSYKKDCDPDVTGSRPVQNSAIHFFNLHWEYSQENFLNSEKKLNGNLILYCSHGISREYKKIYNFKLGVIAKYEGTSFVYKSSRISESPKLIFRLIGNSNLPSP